MTTEDTTELGSTILVVDDDEEVRAYLASVLKRNGYQVRVAENGRAGLKIVFEEQIDLVITDFVMPNGGGMEFLVKLMEYNVTQARKVKVCLITGNMILPEDFARDAGCEACLSKPFSKDALLEMCKAALAK